MSKRSLWIMGLFTVSLFMLMLGAQAGAARFIGSTTPLSTDEILRLTQNVVATQVLQTATRESFQVVATELSNTTSPQVVLEVQLQAPVAGANWNRDHSQILSWDDAGNIILWNAATGEVLVTMEQGAPVAGTRWNRDQTQLLSWNYGPVSCSSCTFDAKLWDVNPASDTFGTLLLTLQQPDPGRFLESGEALWNPDESLIVTWSRSGTAHVWNAQTGVELLVFRHNNIIWGARWNADGTKLLTWSTDRTARVWDVQAALSVDAARPTEIKDAALVMWHDDAVWGARWSPDERYILTWALDGTGALWDAQTGDALGLLPHTHFVWLGGWSSDGADAFTGAFDGTLKRWRIADLNPAVLAHTQHPAAVLERPGEAFTRLEFHPTLPIAAVGSARSISAWDYAAGELRFSRPLHTYGLLWSPDGRYLLSWSGDGAAQVWGGTVGELQAVLLHNAPVKGAVWRDDGAQMMIWAEDGSVRVWEAALAEPSTIAQTPLPIVTGTPRPTQTLNAEQQTATAFPVPPSPTVARASRLTADHANRQSFVPQDARILHVDVELVLGDLGNAGGTNLTLNITTLDGNMLGSKAQFVPAGFSGWLRFEFPEGVSVTPGQSHLLELSSTLGEQQSYFNWVFGDDFYPDGALGYPIVRPQWDYRFRINSAESAVIVPPMTATPTLTPTPVPPLQTATVEAGWYAARITVGTDPRTAQTSPLVIPAGQTVKLYVGIEECCYFLYPLDEAVTWSIEPSTGATLDAVTGDLTFAAERVSDTYMVTAQTVGGLTKTAQIQVYDPSQNPLVGVWREAESLDCETGEFVKPDQSVGELIFKADGRFQVTYWPFEVYVDYVGQYYVDSASGGLVMIGQYLNYFPSDFDGSGLYELDEQGRLVLRNIWLGSPPTQNVTPVYCGHRFQRVG